jgi:hypothetical protein
MLYTVAGTFSDFSAAYEQYEAVAPAEALAFFIMHAESLGGYDPKSRAAAAEADGHKVTQVAGGAQGLWIWHPTVQLEKEDVVLYGGCIVQTDPAGSARVNGPS